MAEPASRTDNRTRFEKDLSAPDPIPQEGIDAAVELMHDGRLFRYAEDRHGVPVTALLEEEFAAAIGRRYAVGVNSGGCALFLGLKSAGVMPGDKVLLNAFTLAPVPGAIAHAGAQAVLVDITDSYTIDIEDLDRKARESGARFLMLSYMRGHVPDMDAVMAVCRRHGLVVVEDCAHTMGAHWDGRLVGTFGDVACFSTQTFKHLNSGEGGLLATDDEDAAARAVLMSGSYMLYAQHRARPEMDVFERHRYTTPNFSMRMSGLVASILRPQLALLDERVARWREAHGRLVELLRGVEHISIPERSPKEGYVPSSLQFHLTGLDAQAIDTFLRASDEHGVHVKWFGREEPVGFTSRHDHWRYLEGPTDVPRADRVLQGLCDMRLPLWLDEEDCQCIAAVLREAMAEATSL
ncbi:MAG: aminotransferase class I/II-fold pyridoxal phosphate-dependent enzyme [Gammaproteobacteria bacterium]|nr:aminotransferase class I/II-fold pyridoxal phosphate-dependent enzyme [Acidobacteriota bacterium]NIP46856.1 DegT/DnrJ/EryC1/StrS aminotransferase family protein [Gammaproteobacteria bacterium]NIP64373.1 aminotransferase class I/II-fold pyridoxal phosphate-dependent enzyme [Gammaproteobacteria bacterium]NIQ26779.1 aminotransferase class I/II-fold pyridoxal phosphate-dependent enzyme [Gammaproteobacteria bacterium]NIR19833.1 aminotransferase class I/II-fold pyridoxal phosphate-dependent enzyme